MTTYTPELHRELRNTALAVIAAQNTKKPHHEEECKHIAANSPDVTLALLDEIESMLLHIAANADQEALREIAAERLAALGGKEETQ